MRSLLTGLLAGALLVGCSQEAPSPETSTSRGERQEVLEPWRAAMSQADSQTANIVVLGDSVSEGLGLQDSLNRRWIDRLQAGLRESTGVADCPTTPAGFNGTTSVVPAQYRGRGMPQPRLEGRAEHQLRAGPGGRAVDLYPGSTISWPVIASSVDIGYRTRQGGGPIQVTIDGEVPDDARSIPTDAALVTNGDGRGHRRVWSSGDLGPGRHTVTVRNVAPAGSQTETTVTDLTPFRGDRDRCVHVLDAARTGVTTAGIAGTPAYIEDSLDLNPDLLLVPLGFNDVRRGYPPAEFGRSLDTVIAQVRKVGYSGPILLIGWFTPQLAYGLPSWADYLDEMSKRREQEGVSFLNLSGVLPMVEAAPQGVYDDHLHPGLRGHRLIAQALLRELGPPQD